MARNAITVKELEKKLSDVKLIAISQKKPRNIGCGKGVVLYVYATGEATYFAHVPNPDNGKFKNIRLGAYNKITLESARKKAQVLINQAKKECNDLQIEKDLSPLFSTYIDEWIESKRSTLRNSKRYSNLKSLRKHLKCLDNYRLKEINLKLVYDLVSKVDTTQGNKHNAVSMLVRALRGAVQRGYIEFNPLADMLKGTESPFKMPTARGFAWVRAEELKEKFFEKVKNTALICKVLYLYIVYTGARFNEARLLQWSWIDYKNKIIKVPAEKTKANREHKIPLTEDIEDLLKFWRTIHYNQNSDLVFYSESNPKIPTCEGTFQTAVTANTNHEITLHGLRKSMRTWLSENGVPLVIAEMLISHDKRDKLIKIYDKNDHLEERKTALLKWQKYIKTQIPTEFIKNKNVITIIL